MAGYTGPSYYPGRQDNLITDLILQQGRARAEGAARSGEIWSHAIDQLGQIAGAGVQHYADQKNQGEIGQAVLAASSPQYPSATKPGPVGSGAPIDPGSYQGPPGMTPDMSGRVPDSGQDHMANILASVAPENRAKVIAGVQATQEAAAKAEQTVAAAKEHSLKVQQTVADTFGTFASALEQHLGEADGGIGLANSGLGGLGASPALAESVKRLAPFAAQAKQALDSAQTPEVKAAVVDAWRQQVKPLLDQGKAGMSVEAQEKWAQTQKTLADAAEAKTEKIEITNPDGSKTIKIVEKKPGQTFESAAPPGHDEERYIRGQYGPNPTPQQLLAGRAAYAAAGRDPANDAAPTLTPAGIEMAALRYRKDGTLPAMGMGGKGANVRQIIMNRAATLTPQDITRIEAGGGDIAGNKANFAADTASLKALQKQTDTVSAFESTASKNAKLLDDALAALPDTGISILNKPLRSAETVLGSEGMAKFNALRQSVQNEYARMISSPGLAGTMSDSARKEGEALLSPDATVGQIRAAIATLRAEAANRHSSYQQQIADIHGRMGGTSVPTPAAPKADYRYDPASGKLIKN